MGEISIDAARRFAVETWGETWADAEMGALLEFAALAAQPPNEGGAPAGWKLVPSRPYPEMLAAWWRTKNTGTTEIGGEREDSSDVAAYRAMLAAAPTEPAGEDGGGEDEPLRSWNTDEHAERILAANQSAPRLDRIEWCRGELTRRMNQAADRLARDHGLTREELLANAKAVLASAPAPQPDDLGKLSAGAAYDFRHQAREMILAAGWKPGDQMHGMALIELMAKFGQQMREQAVEERCNYPDCGCERDSVCAEGLRILRLVPAPAAPQATEEPVATVVWYDPAAHWPPSRPDKIIDASLAFIEAAPIGTKLYAAPAASRIGVSEEEIARQITAYRQARAKYGGASEEASAERHRLYDLEERLNDGLALLAAPRAGGETR